MHRGIGLSIATALVCACASDPVAPAEHSQEALLLSVDQENAAGREIVAQVNGQPIYDDCVTRQAASHALDRQAALQECIDFALLAQAAHQPAYLQAPQVQEIGKQELVRAFLTARYPIQGPGDFDDKLARALWEQISVPRFNHPELRNIVSCRIPRTVQMSPETAEYKAAAAFFAMLYDELKDRRDLSKDDLFANCYDRYKDQGVADLKLHSFRLGPRTSYEASLQATIFDGPEQPGQLLPPVSTPQSWHLLLLLDSKPPLETSYEQAEPELRDALYTVPVYQSKRNALFGEWFDAIAKDHKVTTFPEHLPKPEPELSAANARPGP